jgi:hypothetical protein
MSAHPLSVIITEGSGTGSKLAALSSINFLPANPIVEKDFIIYWIQNNQPERA